MFGPCPGSFKHDTPPVPPRAPREGWGVNERGFVMKCYVSAADCIGAIETHIYQTREFVGHLAGYWRVEVISPFRGFIWPEKAAVMDDFGNLVAVEV